MNAAPSTLSRIVRFVIGGMTVVFVAGAPARAYAGPSVDTLELTRVVFVADRIDFRAEGESPGLGPVEITGPYIVDVPVNDGVFTIDTAAIAPGIYLDTVLELSPLADPNDPNLVNRTDLPASMFTGISFHITGRINGDAARPFTFTDAGISTVIIDDPFEVDAGEPFEYSLVFDTGVVFIVEGMLLDPRDSANQEPIGSRLPALFHRGEPGAGPGPDGEFVFLQAEIQSTTAASRGGVNAITLIGRSITLDDQTRVEGPIGELIPTTDLVAGRRVEAQGTLAQDGSIRGFGIELKPLAADLPNFIEFDGAPIDSVNMGGGGEVQSIVALGLTVAVDGTTRILDDMGGPLTAAALVSGAPVELDGFVQPGGSIVTGRIEVGRMSDEVEFEGRVLMITPGGSPEEITLDVSGVTVRTNAETEYFDHLFRPATSAQLVVDGRIVAEGERQPDDSLLAGFIDILVTPTSDFVEIGAKIQTVTPGGTGVSSFTAAGITVDLDGQTLVFDDDEMLVASSEILVGLQCDVVGTVQPSGSVLASVVELFGAFGSGPAFSGAGGRPRGPAGGSVTVSISGTGPVNGLPASGVGLWSLY